MSTRDKLLQAFEGRSGQVLSGAALARKLGVSRTSVWKHVRTLRAQGLPIESADRNGYRFCGTADFSLMKPEFSKPTTAWVTPHYEIATPSTQKLAKGAAEAGIPEGHLWIAETQTAGRGRLDRVWESGFGGLWFSLLLRPSLPPVHVPPVTLVAALSLAEAMQEVCDVPARLKWPNDVVIPVGGSWKKAAGVLTEMSGEMDRTHWVVMGVGVNVNNELPPALANRAVSLAQFTGRAVSRSRLLDAFLIHFRPRYRQLQKENFEVFQAAYWKLYSRPDAEIRVQTSQGEITGIARGVDGAGALIVESRRNIHHLSEGEIVL